MKQREKDLEKAKEREKGCRLEKAKLMEKDSGKGWEKGWGKEMGMDLEKAKLMERGWGTELHNNPKESCKNVLG